MSWVSEAIDDLEVKVNGGVWFSGDDRTEKKITDISVVNMENRDVRFEIKGVEVDNWMPGADPDTWTSEFVLNINNQQDLFTRFLIGESTIEEFIGDVDLTKNDDIVEESLNFGTFEQLDDPEAHPEDLLRASIFSLARNPSQLKRAANQNINQLREYWTRNIVQQSRRREQRSLNEQSLIDDSEITGLGGSIQGIGTAGSTMIGGHKLGSTPEREAPHVELG